MSGFKAPMFPLGMGSPEGAPAGNRSMLAPWVGGASSPVETSGGYRSLLAFWAGGACSATSTPPSPPIPRPIPGGAPRRNQRQWERFHGIIQDDNEMMELLTLIIPAICQDD